MFEISDFGATNESKLDYLERYFKRLKKCIKESKEKDILLEQIEINLSSVPQTLMKLIIQHIPKLDSHQIVKDHLTSSAVMEELVKKLNAEV